jgi:hypothetical protein
VGGRGAVCQFWFFFFKKKKKKKKKKNVVQTRATAPPRNSSSLTVDSESAVDSASEVTDQTLGAAAELDPDSPAASASPLSSAPAMAASHAATFASPPAHAMCSGVSPETAQGSKTARTPHRVTSTRRHPTTSSGDGRRATTIASTCPRPPASACPGDPAPSCAGISTGVQCAMIAGPRWDRSQVALAATHAHAAVTPSGSVGQTPQGPRWTTAFAPPSMYGVRGVPTLDMRCADRPFLTVGVYVCVLHI